MSNRPGRTRAITKADILGGRNAVRSVWIAPLEAEVPIRPLTIRQKAEVEAAAIEGIEINDPNAVKGLLEGGGAEMADMAGVNVNLGSMMIAGSKAQTLAVHYGLALDEPVSLAEVDEMDALVVSAIARHVYRISGIKDNSVDTEEDQRQIAEFRDQ